MQRVEGPFTSNWHRSRRVETTVVKWRQSRLRLTRRDVSTAAINPQCNLATSPRPSGLNSSLDVPQISVSSSTGSVLSSRSQKTTLSHPRLHDRCLIGNRTAVQPIKTLQSASTLHSSTRRKKASRLPLSCSGYARATS